METSWLIARLENPALLQKGDEQRLRELIATYPYFSAPYLLLARSLKEQNHPAFEQLLPLISLQAYDRKRLFRLIHEEERKAVPSAGAESEVVRHTERSRSATDIPETPVEEMRGLGDEEVNEDAVVRHPEQANELSEIEETPRRVEGPEPITQYPEPRFAVNFSEVEKTDEEPSFAVHEELEEIPFLLTMDHGPLTIAEREDEVEVEEESTVNSRQSTEEVAETNSHQPIPITQNPEPLTQPPARIDFIHWLEKLQPVKKVEAEVEVEEMRGLGDEEDNEDEIVRHTERSRSATDITETMNQEVSRHGSAPLTKTGDQHPDSLIEKFIQTNPSVSRVKERFYDPAVQAKESERLDDTLMTETLARIFVKQEKYERAIDAYRKLQLKYPEKSDYFAALISEINSKIH